MVIGEGEREDREIGGLSGTFHVVLSGCKRGKLKRVAVCPWFSDSIVFKFVDMIDDVGAAAFVRRRLREQGKFL